jgi:hypothetical protein
MACPVWLPLLGFPISLRYIGINFSPKDENKKTRSAVADRVFFAPLIGGMLQPFSLFELANSSKHRA